MRFEDWEPFYDRILKDFGYSREADRRSARLLDRRVGGFDIGRIDDLLRGETVAVAGDGPSLDADEVRSEVVVAADGVSERLREDGVKPDVVVTDLDGAPEYAAGASHDGALVAVHAHGDNAGLLRRRLDEFETRNVVGTTQTRPFGDLHNFGGFTDGDRAAFLADAFGASRVRLLGFDFDEATGEKLEKLRWARRLLRVLAHERSETLI